MWYQGRKMTCVFEDRGGVSIAKGKNGIMNKKEIGAKWEVSVEKEAKKEGACPT